MADNPMPVGAAEIYRKAARMLEREQTRRFACPALERACNGRFERFDPLITAFADYFKPRNCQRGDEWFGCGYVDENRERRILALCFMAAIAESE